MTDLSSWAERRPSRTEAERVQIARDYASHLPIVPGGAAWEDADIDAMKAAFIARFDEDLPRKETLMFVASIGYRAAIRDLLRDRTA